MFDNSKITEKAILVGVHTGSRDILSDCTAESMAELAALAETAGAEVLGEITQNRDRIDTATYVGEGKLEEIREACENLEANLVIFDDELTGSQLKNIESALSVRVIDRSALILDIFAGRALSGEGKLQVELAQLKYTLPRLAGGYQSMSRLGGGIGTRGPGETKIESDRRHIRTRIHALEDEIAEIKKHRELIRARRTKNQIPTAALVGYTNSGKSTLLNLLTGAGVLAENMLFATLDPTARGIIMPDGRQAILVDTVGFIRKLPHHLIEAFKSTLEEAVTADVLLHVIDTSSPETENQIQVVESLLSQLGCDGKPRISVYNKIDLTDNFTPRAPYPETSVFISAAQNRGIDELMTSLDELLPGKRRELTVLLPYSMGGAANEMREANALISEEYTPEGIKLSFLADPSMYAKYKDYKIQQ